MSQGAQKKTGFRSLKNVDNLKLNTKQKKEGARDTINTNDAYDSPFEETPTKTSTKMNRASQKEFPNMEIQNLSNVRNMGSKNDRINASDLKLNFTEHEIVVSETPVPDHRVTDLV